MFAKAMRIAFIRFACVCWALSLRHNTIRIGTLTQLTPHTHTRWSPLVHFAIEYFRALSLHCLSVRDFNIIDDGGRFVSISLLSILYLTCFGSKSFAVGLFLCLFVCLFGCLLATPSIATEWKSHERQVLRSDNNKMSIDRYSRPSYTVCT